jgi:hypothetical protein
MRAARGKVKGPWASGPYARLTAFRRNGLREVEVFLWRASGGAVLMYARYTNTLPLAGRPGVLAVTEDDFQPNALPGELQAWYSRYGSNSLEIHCDSQLRPGEHPFDALRRSEARYWETELARSDFTVIEDFLANRGGEQP